MPSIPRTGSTQKTRKTNTIGPQTVLNTVPEAAVLTLLAVLPAFINLATYRIFEEEKSLLLRAAAVVVLVGLAGTFPRWRHRMPWRHPIVLAFGALLAALVAASLFAIAPRDAWLGAYVRHHGTLAWLSLAVVFIAMVNAARVAGGRERILAAAVIGSIWPSAYALVQAAGLDPVAWTDVVPGRAGSTAGNPILLGGYLAVTIPLTAALAWRTRGWVLCLVLQFAALAASGSRGPLLAGAAAMIAFGLAVPWNRRRAWLLTSAAVVVVAGLGLVATQPALRPPALDRFADAGAGSGRVRVLIWSGISSLMRESGWRQWIGYGPESLRRVFPPYYSWEIGRIEMTEAMPDRAHNETLDTYVSGGVIGALCSLALLATVAFGALRVRERRWRAALTAAAISHAVEIQLGIATVISRLVYMSVAALVVGTQTREQSEPATERADGGAAVPWRALVVAAAVGAASAPLSALAGAIGLPSAGDASTLLAGLWRISMVTAALYALVLAAGATVARMIAPPDNRRAWPTPSALALVAAACVAAVLLSVTPSRADVYAKAGAAFEASRRWEEAVIVYTEATRIQPQQEAYWTRVGRAAIQQGSAAAPADQTRHFVAARAALERAVLLNPHDPNHPRNLASLFRVRARLADEANRAALLADADRQYTRAAQLAPGLPTLWVEWANVDAERRRLPESITKLNHAITLDPQAADAWMLRGLARTLSGQVDLALADYERALSLRPADVVALRGRAVALAELGRRDAALTAVEELLRLQPQDAIALRLKARLAR